MRLPAMTGGVDEQVGIEDTWDTDLFLLLAGMVLQLN